MWPNVIDARDIINGTVPVPSSPGIYAWYRRLAVDDTTEENFLKSIETIMSNATWPNMEGGKGRIGPYETNMDLRPFSRLLSGSKRNIAQGIAYDARARASLARLVLAAR